MAVKSVVDVDVDTAKWERFQQLFDKYTSALDKTPNVWKNVGKEQAALTSHFERMTAALMAQATQAQEEVEARAKEEKSLTTNERLWRSMASSTKSVAGNVLHATTSLLKWTGILTGIGGLLGGGALFGLDKLAGGLGNERRTAMGLGMSVGQYRAFNLDFSRALDTEKFLGDVQEMMTNPAAARPLWQLGVNPNGKTEDVAKAYMDRLRTLAVNTPTSKIGLLNTQYGTSLSTPEWMRLHEMSPDEYGKMREANAADRKNLEVADPIARKWQEFGIQLDRAGLQIKNIFEIRLEKLLGPLTRLSEDFVKTADAVARGPLIGDAISLVAKGLNWFAKQVSSDTFQQSIVRFEQSIEGLAAITARVYDKLKWILPQSGDEKSNPTPSSSLVSPNGPSFLLNWASMLGTRRGEKIGEDLAEKWFGRKSGESTAAPVVPLLPRAPSTPADSSLDLSPILGPNPTSWNPNPITNSYASNRNTVNNTTNNYGTRGGSGSLTVNIVAPPGFSAITTVAGLNAGLS